MHRCVALIASVILCSFVAAGEPVDLEAVNKIRYQGFHRSQVMDLARQLALPEQLRETTWPVQPLAGHATLSSYFNLDYGAGRIRGIFLQENVAAKPIFEAWLEPLHDVGATTISPKTVGGTDHRSFDRVGIPAFQFIQDPLDYMGRTHHTNVDTFDHLHRDDLMQASVVLATFIWHAATRDEMMPRKPLPTEPPAK